VKINNKINKGFGRVTTSSHQKIVLGLDVVSMTYVQDRLLSELQLALPLPGVVEFG